MGCPLLRHRGLHLGNNLVEIDTPGAGRLPEALRSQLERLEDMRPQTPEKMSARLDAGGAS